MAFPQTKTPLSLTVRKRQRRRSSAVPLLLPVQSPAPQCASNNARPVITGACRSRLLGRRYRPFSRKARRGSSHGHPALPCTIRQLSAAFFPGTLSRHSRIFHCHGVYSSAGSKSRKTTLLVFHPAHAKSEASSCNGCFVVPCGYSPLPCRWHGLCPVHDGFQPQQWRRRQRLRLSHRHCGGGRAGAYCHGKLRGIPIAQGCLT